MPWEIDVLSAVDKLHSKKSCQWGEGVGCENVDCLELKIEQRRGKWWKIEWGIYAQTDGRKKLLLHRMKIVENLLCGFVDGRREVRLESRPATLMIYHGL